MICDESDHELFRWKSHREVQNQIKLQPNSSFKTNQDFNAEEVKLK